MLVSHFLLPRFPEHRLHPLNLVLPSPKSHLQIPHHRVHLLKHLRPAGPVAPSRRRCSRCPKHVLRSFLRDSCISIVVSLPAKVVVHVVSGLNLLDGVLDLDEEGVFSLGVCSGI